MWLLEEDPATGEFVCRCCLGELHTRRWTTVVEQLIKPGFGSLAEEVRYALRGAHDERDELFDACGQSRLAVPLSPTETAALFEPAVSNDHENCFLVARPLAGDLESAGVRFRAKVTECVRAASPGATFDVAPATFAFGLRGGGGRVLVVFSQPYSEAHEHPSLVLTSAYLQQLGRVLAEWRTSIAAMAEED